MSQLLVSEQVLILKAIFQENRNVNTERESAQNSQPYLLLFSVCDCCTTLKEYNFVVLKAVCETENLC